MEVLWRFCGSSAEDVWRLCGGSVKVLQRRLFELFSFVPIPSSLLLPSALSSANFSGRLGIRRPSAGSPQPQKVKTRSIRHTRMSVATFRASVWISASRLWAGNFLKLIIRAAQSRPAGWLWLFVCPCGFRDLFLL